MRPIHLVYKEYFNETASQPGAQDLQFHVKRMASPASAPPKCSGPPRAQNWKSAAQKIVDCMEVKGRAAIGPLAC